MSLVFELSISFFILKVVRALHLNLTKLEKYNDSKRDKNHLVLRIEPLSENKMFVKFDAQHSSQSLKKIQESQKCANNKEFPVKMGEPSDDNMRKKDQFSK